MTSYWCAYGVWSRIMMIVTVGSVFCYNNCVRADFIALPAVIIHANNKSVTTDNGSPSEATETQHATCRIVTEKLVATASATVTRALKGVCATKDLEQKFSNLQNEIKNQIEPMRAILLKMDRQINILQTIFEQQDKQIRKSEIKNAEDVATQNIVSGPRSTEITQYNHTLHTDSNGNVVFSYFWKVDNIRRKISSQNHQQVLCSPKFYIDNGYRMIIKLSPYQTKDNVYIHVSLTHGQYDDFVEWPFKLKHQVAILDQSVDKTEDLVSGIWDPTVLCTLQAWQRPTKSKDNQECVGFGFTQTTIFSKNYVFFDSIVIKLDVFLL